MNIKTQAILIKTAKALTTLGWTPDADYEITVKSEGYIPLTKHVGVAGEMGDEEWRDDVETSIHLKLSTDDELTYFPSYTIYASIEVEGAVRKDIAVTTDADVAFTEKDARNDEKISLAGRKIDRLVQSYIEQAYDDYVEANTNQILHYKQGGGMADQDLER
jgi:hypothetical protein